MPLTDTAIRTAKPQTKTVRMFDGGGLYLELAPSGGKWWRLKYRVEGKEKRISLGTYPTIGLKEARLRRDDAKRLLANGIDPSAQRQATKASIQSKRADSFEAVSREWFAKHVNQLAPSYGKKVRSLFEKKVFPVFGGKHIAEVEPSDILMAARHVEESGALETAHRLVQLCGQLLRYGIATGRCKYDITQGLHGALPKVSVRHMSTITDRKRVGELLRAIDAYGGFLPVKSALRLAPLLFVRPGELRAAEWSEIDFDNAEWRIPASKMKMKQRHIVPLARQSLAILNELSVYTGHGRFLFPSMRTDTKPISLESLVVALRAMGFGKEEIVPHGFRSMASTLLNELGYNRDWIERQLAHAERNHVRAAYNHAEFLPERRRMMQEWADFLDEVRGNVSMALPRS
ncbi:MULTISPECIES: integrase arm-type DNA-binding domain-containing protein [unclassified Desulfovibrio]|uniref:tyrosine-type recombinase/integrase n=1 Tax=unclassified Desulfovibrio TaxID=2593640 RepID=UPI0013EA7C92|nr:MULTISPECIES: integrase arm-type DNA-binding domain-containing protein [unclassified Desulfovibrio]